VVVEAAQLRESLGVEAGRIGVGGNGRLDRGRVPERDRWKLQLLAQPGAGSSDEPVELGPGALLRHDGDRLASGGLLKTQVDANRGARFRAEHEIRAQEHDVRADVLSDA